MSKKLLRLIAVALLLAAIPITQAISLDRSAPITIDNSYGAGSMWSDPCTLDGFVVGAGLVLRNPLAVAGALIKAIYVDKCF